MRNTLKKQQTRKPPTTSQTRRACASLNKVVGKAEQSIRPCCLHLMSSFTTQLQIVSWMHHNNGSGDISIFTLHRSRNNLWQQTRSCAREQHFCITKAAMLARRELAKKSFPARRAAARTQNNSDEKIATRERNCDQVCEETQTATKRDGRRTW